MILVRIESIGREEQVGAGLLTQIFDCRLGLVPVRRQPPVRNLQHSDPQVGTRTEGGKRGMLLVFAFGPAAREH